MEKNMKKYASIIVLVSLLVAGISYMILPMLGHEVVEKSNAPTKIEPYDIVYGSPNAPVTIIEFASLTCSHCGNFYNHSLPEIKSNLIDSGEAKLVMKLVAFDKVAFNGMEAAFCLDTRTARADFVNDIFKNQHRLVNHTTPEVYIYQTANKYATPKSRACFEDKESEDEAFKSTKESVENFDIKGTPTFFVYKTNNPEKIIKFVGNQTIDKFNQVIHELNTRD